MNFRSEKQFFISYVHFIKTCNYEPYRLKQKLFNWLLLVMVILTKYLSILYGCLFRYVLSLCLLCSDLKKNCFSKSILLQFRIAAVELMLQYKSPSKAQQKFGEIFAHELNCPPPGLSFFSRNRSKFKKHGTVKNLVCIITALKYY